MLSLPTKRVFGLTSFLNYAERELKQNALWLQLAEKEFGVRYELPWRSIDQQFVETEGFLREQLSFSVDTYRILELLTGHTLYNDTSVVVRELVQNAIDAVRLQFFDPLSASTRDRGRVCIHWDSEARILSVLDNGTGMNEAIIRDHLLKVGSSRYQDPKFREANPEFTPISRFGIGVLSAFMVADDVEYITCFPGEGDVRRILLRSLHGKYLTRLVPRTDLLAQRVLPHGTEVRLKLRPTANFGDVKALVSRYIVIPGCSVTLQIDEEEPTPVGFLSPKEALESSLINRGMLDPEERTSNIRVDERAANGVTIAYALEWSEYFREWSFLARADRRSLEEDIDDFIGTCVEGIRVSGDTPGFSGRGVYALVNATGKTAPRTNVARSGLEYLADENPTMKTIYELYLKHVEAELESLQSGHAYSITWAAREAKYLIDSLLNSRQEFDEELVDEGAFMSAVADFRGLLVDTEGKRNLVSPASLASVEAFWTVDSNSFRSVERLLEEVPGNLSLGSLSAAIEPSSFDLPPGPLLCHQAASSVLMDAVFSTREVSHVDLRRADRRVDLKWVQRAESPRWIVPSRDWPRMSRRLERRWDGSRGVIGGRVVNRSLGGRSDRISILGDGVCLAGAEDFNILETSGHYYFLASEIQLFFQTRREQIVAARAADAYWIAVTFCIESAVGFRYLDHDDVTEVKPGEQWLKWLEEYTPYLHNPGDGSAEFDNRAFMNAMHNTPFRRFSTDLWQRKRADEW
jgi:molecular chaperone HtpG